PIAPRITPRANKRRTAALTDACTLAGRRAIRSTVACCGNTVRRASDWGTMRLQSELAHYAGLVDADLFAGAVHRLPVGFVPDAYLAARAGEDDVLLHLGVIAQRRRN